MEQIKCVFKWVGVMAILMIWTGNLQFSSAATAPGREKARQTAKERESSTSADHREHDILQAEFASGPDVTMTCLECHPEAAEQFQKTVHWTWIDPKSDPKERIGKAGLSINNFCISIHSNEPRCTSCHAGYGWKDSSFDFSDPSKIDCLICHEQTGTYKKFPSGAGNPVIKPAVFKDNGQEYLPPEWNKVAQSVGRPSRKNCGTCHFFGGGGDGVKHGDLDSSLTAPDRELDVHMGINGQNFDCVRCHTTNLHEIGGGTYYIRPNAEENRSPKQHEGSSRITCESCHTAAPHKSGSKANDHTDKVACQSCHIPSFARVLPTKMRWDWSSAGKKKDGKPYKEKGAFGYPSYDSRKGNFVWEKNVKPEYFWYNGSLSSLTAKDGIDPTGEIKVSWPIGDQNDPDSRISPFKVHRGKLPYDKISKTLLIPHLFGKEDSDAYAVHFDWKRAFESGMKHAGLKFSGEYDFAETSYAYPTTHMVVPSEHTVKCAECHTRRNGRLAKLGGFYMPGRDGFRLVNTGGWGIVLISFAGIVLHGLGRIISLKKGKKK